jgi:hypothetical protein
VEAPGVEPFAHARKFFRYHANLPPKRRVFTRLASGVSCRFKPSRTDELRSVRQQADNTIFRGDLPGAPGSIADLTTFVTTRACAARLREALPGPAVVTTKADNVSALEFPASNPVVGHEAVDIAGPQLAIALQRGGARLPQQGVGSIVGAVLYAVIHSGV